MTLLDLIKLGLIKTNAMAEQFAADLIDQWHNDAIPGDLYDILGLTRREYQAWTTGGVSLLTIAHWQRNSHPPLDPNKPWFKITGKPGQEVVGYLDEKIARKRKLRTTTSRTNKKPA